jgi:hypothetical protein
MMCLSSDIQAELFKCLSKNGNPAYQDKPCTETTQDISNPTTTPPSKSTPAKENDSATKTSSNLIPAVEQDVTKKVGNFSLSTGSGQLNEFCQRQNTSIAE